jgi:ATP synthase protein I
MNVHDARILRGAALPTIVVAVIVCVVTAIVGGGDALLGAAFGSVVVLAFFAVGWWLVAWAGRISPQAMLQMAVASYIVKVGVVLGIVYGVHDVTGFDGKAFSWAVIACTLVWVVAEVRAFSREKILYVEPERGEAKSGKDGSNEHAMEPRGGERQ